MRTHSSSTRVDFPTPMFPATATNFFILPPYIKSQGDHLAARWVSLLWDFSGELFIDHLLENVKRLCADDWQTVDEERGRRTDAHVEGEIDIDLDRLLISMFRHAGFKGGHVQAEIPGVLCVDLTAEGFTAEKFFVVRPEGVLFARAHDGFRGGEGIRMYGCERQVTVDHADLAGICGKQRFIDLFMPAAAVRALEIAELDDGDRSVFGPERVGARARGIIADILRVFGCDRRTCGHRTVSLVRGLRALGGLCSPRHVPAEDPRGKRQHDQHRVKMAPFEGDGIFLLDRLLYLKNFYYFVGVFFFFFFSFFVVLYFL